MGGAILGDFSLKFVSLKFKVGLRQQWTLRVCFFVLTALCSLCSLFFYVLGAGFAAFYGAFYCGWEVGLGVVAG